MIEEGERRLVARWEEVLGVWHRPLTFTADLTGTATYHPYCELALARADDRLSISTKLSAFETLVGLIVDRTHEHIISRLTGTYERVGALRLGGSTLSRAGVQDERGFFLPWSADWHVSDHERGPGEISLRSGRLRIRAAAPGPPRESLAFPLRLGEILTGTDVRGADPAVVPVRAVELVVGDRIPSRPGGQVTRAPLPRLQGRIIVEINGVDVDIDADEEIEVLRSYRIRVPAAFFAAARACWPDQLPGRGAATVHPGDGAARLVWFPRLTYAEAVAVCNLAALVWWECLQSADADTLTPFIEFTEAARRVATRRSTLRTLIDPPTSTMPEPANTHGNVAPSIRSLTFAGRSGSACSFAALHWLLPVADHLPSSNRSAMPYRDRPSRCLTRVRAV